MKTYNFCPISGLVYRFFFLLISGTILFFAVLRVEGMPDRFFAPYVDATLYPSFDIAAAAQNPGTKYFTLAFIVAAGDTAGVDPLTLNPTTLSAWGGQNTLRVNSNYMKSDIAALRAQGGDVMISFGGAANTELAGLYSNPYNPSTQAAKYQQREAINATHLAEAYQFVIDTYELTHIDFDIEGRWVASPYSIQLRAKAIKILQDNAATMGRTLVVWYTLPVLPTGLDANGMNVLNVTLDAGVDLEGVNVMAMDYGDTSAPIVDPATKGTVIPPNIPPREVDNSLVGEDADDNGLMGDYGIKAAQSLFSQLKNSYSNHRIRLADSQIWRKVGITPMIGVNDIQTEVVDLSEAGELYQFALSKDIGMLAFWSITRDHPAPEGSEGQVSPTHSGLSNPSYAFSKLFLPFSGDGSEAVYLSDAVVKEGDVGTQTVALKLWRFPATDESRVISWQTVDGTATAGNDYQADSGSVTFAPGETEKIVVLTILNETENEENEKFKIEFSTSSAVSLPDTEAIVMILDDDTPPTISVDDQTVREDSSNAVFTVTLSHLPKQGQAVHVDFAVLSGTATANDDFVPLSGTLLFSETETTKTITVPVHNDDKEETSEVFIVSLSNPINATITDKQGLGTIQDNTGTVRGGYVFYINNNWGSGWGGVMKVTNPGPDTWGSWQLSFDARWNANFWEATYNATLSTGDNKGNWYHVLDSPSWTGSISPGETFQFSWTAEGTNTTAPTHVMVNGKLLTQLDLSPGVSVADVVSNEGDDGTHRANFTVSLSEAGRSPVYLSYAIVEGTASEGSDYTTISTGVITVPPGKRSKTIPITIVGDTFKEGNETLQLFIAGVDGRPLPRIINNQATLTITDDDWMPSLFSTSGILREGDRGTKTATITLKLNRAPKATESIHVNWKTVDLTATAGSDYVAKSGVASFATGQTAQTLSFTINGDTNDEELERFSVTFFEPNDCLLGGDHAEVQIIDDDITGSLEGRRVVAYYRGGTLPPPNRVTHINYAFSNLNADGTWALTSIPRGLKDLRKQNPNLKLLVSIGGWTWSANFSAVADDPVKRERFIHSATNLIVNQTLNGIDIDWEWPGATGNQEPGSRDRENFVLLMKETRAALDALEATTGKHYLLSAFTGGGSAQIAGLDFAALSPLFDYINVQGYDLHGPWDRVSGHASGLHFNSDDPASASLNIEAILNVYAAAGIPRKKLVVGVAFYGRKIWATSTANHGLFQPTGWTGETPLYNAVVSNNQTTFPYYWDNRSKAPWLFDDSNKVFITFDDPRSCHEKGTFARNNGYGGVYFWAMDGDTVDFQLLTALYDASAARPLVDSDGDGIYDSWEQTYFKNLTTAQLTTDWDQDGQSDLAEFLSGTDPKNATDCFRLLHLINNQISWTTVPGKSYSVEYSPDLTPGSWITIKTGLIEDHFTETDPQRLQLKKGFYRILTP